MDTLSPHVQDGNTPLKRCSHCPEGQQWHPATPEYFSRRKASRDGFVSKCKICERAYDNSLKARERRQRHWERVAKHRPRLTTRGIERKHSSSLCESVPDGFKRCTNINCQRVFPATTEFFHRDKQKKDGLYSICKMCKQKWQCAYDAKSRQDPEYLEKRRITAHALHRQDPEKRRITARAFYHRNKQQRKEYLRVYFQRPGVRDRERELRRAKRQLPEGREKIRTRNHIRRARQRAIPGKYTTKEIQALLVQQKYRCYSKRCGNAKFKRTKVNGTWQYEYHIDHIIPLSRPECHPTNDISNIGLLCPSCNRSKGDKLLCEWPEGGILMWDGGLVAKRNLLAEQQKGFLA